MSNQDKKQRKPHPEDIYVVEETDMSRPLEIAERLHPSLKESFVPLPPVGTRLTDSQLDAVFAGDRRMLRDLARLAYKSSEDAPK